jgi:DNA (cytosine-5)-methyltransferase 1
MYIENVRGMVDFKLGGVQVTKARMAGGIKLGVVKFIVRALTAMGYQVTDL